MFLEELNLKERKNFLELAHYAIMLDGKMEVEEGNMFNKFRIELQLNEEEYPVEGKAIGTVIKEFGASKKRIKKVALFELWGILLADDNFGEKQEQLVEDIKKEWNFRDYESNKMKRWVQDFKELIIEAYSFMEN